jgi:hypothetical protein
MELALQRTADQVVTTERNLFHRCDENGLAPPHTAAAASCLHRLGEPALTDIEIFHY